MDDFGPFIAAEVMSQIADVNIDMVLVHFDPDILDVCQIESMVAGWSTMDAFGSLTVNTPGTLAGAGSLLGNGVPALMSGCHFISLNILSQVAVRPYHFPTAYLTGPAIVYPLGTGYSAVEMNWRAIPYRAPQVVTAISGGMSGMTSFSAFGGEILSSGAVLWDNVPDS